MSDTNTSQKNRKYLEIIRRSINVNRVSNLLISLGLIILFLTYYKIAFYESRYIVSKVLTNTSTNGSSTSSESNVEISKEIEVTDETRIIIPKLQIDAPIILDVDPYNSSDYQIALSKGVALAKTSANLDELGRSFIFAHSSENFYEASRYNAIFYLVNKLEAGDKFYITYKSQPYEYEVKGREYVKPDRVDLMSAKTDNTTKELYLMTCWPPGTTFQRLIVKAELVSK